MVAVAFSLTATFLFCRKVSPSRGGAGWLEAEALPCPALHGLAWPASYVYSVSLSGPGSARARPPASACQPEMKQKVGPACVQFPLLEILSLPSPLTTHPYRGIRPALPRAS